MKRLLPLLMLLGILAGCVSARITSQMNSAANPIRDGHIIFWVDFADLGLRQAVEGDLEWRAEEIWSDSGIEFSRAHDIVFPGRQYDAPELSEVLDKGGVTGVLYIAASGVGTSNNYVPPFVTSSGGVTTVSGGYVTHQPWGNYEATLYDLENGDVSWYATVAVSGSILHSTDDLPWKMVDAVLENLLKDGAFSGGLERY